VPFVDGQQDEAFADAPAIGHGGDEGVVDHVPDFGVVLLLLPQDGEDDGAAFTDGVFSEFRKNVRFGNFLLVAGVKNKVDDFPDHVGIVELETEGVANGHAATNIQAGEGRANFFQLAVQFDGFFQFTPVINGVFDARIDEKVKHFHLELRVVGKPFLVIAHHLGRAYAEAGSIKFEIRFLIGCHPDADGAFAFY
jgi:hypothetical protein